MTFKRLADGSLHTVYRGEHGRKGEEKRGGEIER